MTDQRKPEPETLLGICTCHYREARVPRSLACVQRFGYPHVSAEGYDPSALEAIQLEDGSTAYIHHPMAMPSDSTILAVQTEVGLEDLAAEDDEGFSTDTVVALEQYASKVSSRSLSTLLALPELPLFGGQDCPVLGYGLGYSLCPCTPAPQLPSHILIQVCTPAWPGLPTAGYTHSCLCCLCRGKAAVRSSDIRPVGVGGFRPSFTWAVEITLWAAWEALPVTFISVPVN